jgi:hypothetical protein
MTVRALILVGLMLALAGVLGWTSAAGGGGGVPVVAARSQSIGPPSIEHAGLYTTLAVRAFESLGFGAPPETPVEELAPPPQEIDIVIQFRHDLTAILREGDRRAALIVDRDHGGARRVVRAGQPYRENWQVTEIGPEAIVLRRGDDRRSVSIMTWDVPPLPQ